MSGRKMGAGPQEAEGMEGAHWQTVAPSSSESFDAERVVEFDNFLWSKGILRASACALTRGNEAPSVLQLQS